jgi:hypothetical protein
MIKSRHVFLEINPEMRDFIEQFSQSEKLFCLPQCLANNDFGIRAHHLSNFIFGKLGLG